MQPLQRMFITSPMGPRARPTEGASTNHHGLDLRGNIGDPIVNIGPGRVVFAGWNKGYGNQVIVDHGNGVQSMYGHMSAINVKVGDIISAGQQVGKMGSTGVSTGKHLHFGLRIKGAWVDPRLYGFGSSAGGKGQRPVSGPPRPKPNTSKPFVGPKQLGVRF